MTVPILLYHQIAVPPPKPMPFRSMFVHPATFSRQMACLWGFGYQGLSLRDALPYIRGEKRGKVVAITFDDGFENVFHTAAPILDRYGFTATNFIVTNQIGGENRWDQPLGIVATPCMRVSQLKSWINKGHEIGSHTLDHVNLNRVPDDVALQQIAESREALSSLLNIKIDGFAYPYGEQSLIHRRMARDAGYTWAVAVKRARAGRTDDLFGLPRITIRRSDTLVRFASRILG